MIIIGAPSLPGTILLAFAAGTGAEQGHEIQLTNNERWPVRFGARGSRGGASGGAGNYFLQWERGIGVQQPGGRECGDGGMGVSGDGAVDEQLGGAGGGDGGRERQDPSERANVLSGARH